MSAISRSVCTLALALAATCVSLGDTAASPAQTEQSAAAETAAVVTATTAFLGMLDAQQRSKVVFPYDPRATPSGASGRFGGGMFGGMFGGRRMYSGEQFGAAAWSNFPVMMLTRPGLSFGSLTASQRTAALHLLQVVLSAKGYQKVLDIMGADQSLADSGTQDGVGTDYYTIGIFGTPSTSSPWMLEFGGHHLGLNVTIAAARSVITPTLTGTQPAVYQSNGKTVRVLAQENDKAFALLDALDPSQRKQAILNYRVADLVLGPGHAGENIMPEGLKGSALNAQQQAMLLDLISEWSGIINDAYQPARAEEVRAGINDTYFAWSGPTTHAPGQNGAAYYRIQGPKLVIEFSPQGAFGDSTQHVHTMYRDPTNDYGRAITQQ